MTKIFDVIEASEDGEIIRVCGRAESTITVGDSLIYRTLAGDEVAVTVIRLESYGRKNPSLGAMWTGEAVLNPEAKINVGIGALMQDEKRPKIPVPGSSR